MGELSQWQEESPLRGNGLLRSSGSGSGLTWSLRSDRGLVREANEDYAFADVPTGGNANQGALFVVADGLGGHEAGEVASRVAVDTVVEAWRSLADKPLKVRLRSAFRLANQAVFDEALRCHNNGMATTLTAVAILGPVAMVAHIGDSRCYHIRGHKVEQLTNDHSQVGEMMRRGLISPSEAASHPARSVLTRCLGRELNTTPEIAQRELIKDDLLVICSDGLWDLVSPQEMVQAIRNEDASGGSQTGDVVEELMKLAIYRGAPDNVTVMIVRAEEQPNVRHSSTTRGHWFKR